LVKGHTAFLLSYLIAMQFYNIEYSMSMGCENALQILQMQCKI